MSELYHSQPYKPNRYTQFPPARPGHKYCVGCEQEKPFDTFHKMKANYDGYRPTCKVCRKWETAHPKTKQALITSKICTKCKNERLLEDFDLDPNGKMGRFSQCKECRSDYNRKFLKDNQELVRGRAREKKFTPGYREKVMDRHRTRSITDSHYLELIRERRQRHYNTHKEQAKDFYPRRKARMLNATVGEVNYAHILEIHGYHCYLCDKPIDPTIDGRLAAGLTFDHIVPLQPRPGEPQGAHSEENLRPAHHTCNVRKGNRPLESLTAYFRRGV